MFYILLCLQWSPNELPIGKDSTTAQGLTPGRVARQDCVCIMLLHGKQDHVTVWQTVTCMANSIMLLYGKQYHVTVW